MSVELSTAGILVKWCIEGTTGGRPTTGYVEIPEIKSIPEFNPEPSQLETTPLSATVWKTYINGLKDVGGAIGVTANFCKEFYEGWNAMVSSYSSGGGKPIWVEFVIPGFKTGSTTPKQTSFYFPAIPSELGFGGAEVDSVLETTAYLTPCGAPVWADAST